MRQVILALGALGVASFLISWLITALMIRLAPRIGFVDKPGHRKIHSNPKPLGGGVAIILAIAIPMLAMLTLVYGETARGTLETVLIAVMNPAAVDKPSPLEPYWNGALQQMPLALAFLGAVMGLHVLGLIDDRKALGPWMKLGVQLLAASALVILFDDIRALTALGAVPSIVFTILWITAITNAFNFLDNMDGLSAGVGAVCTIAFLVTTIIIEQWFVAATLTLLLGALMGFLCWNFPPAKIFMGDSGSLVIGFVLGVLTVRTQYLPQSQDFHAGWYAVFAPVIVLAVPLYDLIVVSIIRISRGKSPFVGDTNHFSHRLVARGMSRRTAVLCIYLVTAATSVAAVLLPYVRSTFGAVLIFVQTLLVLGVVALLEQHPLPVSDERDA